MLDTDSLYVIGITGKKQTGKSTFARAISDIHPNTERYAFAKPLKEVCHTLFGGTEDNWYGDFKSQILDGWQGKLPFEPTPRKIMQFVGTEMFRVTLHNNFWLHVAERYIGDMYYSEEFDVLVIDDVRFDNEAIFIRTTYPKSCIVNLHRSDAKYNDDGDVHVSEKGVSHHLVDYTYSFNGIADHAAHAADLLKRMGIVA